MGYAVDRGEALYREKFPTKREALKSLSSIDWSGYVVAIDENDDDEPTRIWVRSNSDDEVR
jgi:hypothetical protein